MKNTLKANSLLSLIKAWKSFHQAVIDTADTENKEEIKPQDVYGLKGALTEFFTAEFINRTLVNTIHTEQYEGKTFSTQKDFVIITASQKEADECETNLHSAAGDSIEVIKFPWWGTIPYRCISTRSSVFGERESVLAKLSQKNPRGQKPRVFIIPQRSLLTPVPPPEYTKKNVVKIRKGQTLDMEEFASRLTAQGYLRVNKVGMKGEFALRGEVLDIYMSGEKTAHRIVFDFDTVEQIKTFEIESQSSKENLDYLIVYPLKEIVWNDQLTSRLEKILEEEDSDGILNDFASWDQKRRQGKAKEDSFNSTEEKESEDESSDEEKQNRFAAESVHLALTEEGRKEKERLLTELSVNLESEGEELFYGILFDRLYSVLDYIDSDTPVFCLEYDRLLNAMKLLENEYTVSYRTARQNFPVLMPKYMLLDFESLMDLHQRSIRFRSLENTDEKQLENSHEIHCEATVSFFGNINYFKEQLAFWQNEKFNVFIYADNPNQALRINEIVKEYNVQVIPESISEGFSIAEEKIIVIQENEIFGRRKNTPKSIRKAKSKVIDTFVDLNPGDYIVHVNYGIGLFQGIERVKSLGTERDYIKLMYADEETAFVPIEQVNLVQRYIGSENEKPRLDRIGSKSWNARKSKVQQKVEEIAEKLIDLYSKRKASQGFAFPKDNEWNAAFEAAFPYEDTPDQYTATQEIKADMERAVPMDRLVCGDVGYGKTEIAMRAAFKAVMGGKQVAFLAPTTILAEQHYENCIERFKNFPVKIAQLSRFVSPAEQKKTIERLQKGDVDILVGTHKILQKSVIYKDLGLLIIDEEQRFGVKDKEKLKELKHNVDCLAMSATPIPRTLHMSLLKIRDMSLLTTPPQNRQSVETVIEAYNDERIATAIRREVDRGGQVFYLHNRVENLYEIQIKLQKLLPEMMIDIAHGQMSSDQLDDIFRRFKMGGFNVLVATTIIENGINIPNVNTIIIDRADMYGVSQLYQLRGRVGRCDKKAYAYLLYPENKSLSEVAMKRLQVISDFTELGSGFKIAMKDMEIRGAGNLLGKDQSGEVYAVGFEMYLSLLNAAIERLTHSDWQEKQEVLLELEYSGFIPDSYISDAQTKMEMYKKIAAISSDEELNGIYEEMSDRFGPVPDEAASLLSLARIRILCVKLGIISLKEKRGNVEAVFSPKTKVSIDKLLTLVKASAGRIKLDPLHPNSLFMKTDTIDLKVKSDFILEKLLSII
ncbi:transcription-repair coupling factor [Treponema sp.]|uniref:transcription-repair coupling factor n=1 Tax=Treponema sp. TaxID=166 RepID=UPI0025F92433|nr:transcription-repair coupling factor [Treponema sp.]MCR5218317.1 transcription-repair coupling factor [Treponema sp.]